MPSNLQDDFSNEQAGDLARHFLGAGWMACLRNDGCRMLIGPGFGDMCVGLTWRAVFRAAGVKLPMRAQFVAQGLRVAHGARAICTAVSNTTAKRIAAALNEHETDRRGI